jgi:hypothetical protein
VGNPILNIRLGDVIKGEVEGKGDGTKLSDITLSTDFFLERKSPSSEQLFGGDVAPAKDDAQTCGDGLINLSDIVALIDLFLERKTIEELC